MYMKAIERATYKQYNAKPPGKRPNFKKLSTTSPFAADWNSLLTLQSTELLLIEQLLSCSSESLADSPPQEGKDSTTTKKEEMDMDEEEEEEEEDKKPKDQKSKKEDKTTTTKKDKESVKKTADLVEEKNEETLAKEDAEVVKGKVLPYYILRGRELYDLIGEQKTRAQQRRRHQEQQQHQQARVEWQEKKTEDDSTPMDTTQQQQEEDEEGKEEGRVRVPDSSTTTTSTSVEERVSVALLSSCFVGVTIRMAKRGTPTFNAMICRPTAEDIRLWRANPSRFEPVISEVDCREVQHTLLLAYPEHTMGQH